MDIRSFFAKKPSKKKSSGTTVSTSVAVASASTESKDSSVEKRKKTSTLSTKTRITNPDSPKSPTSKNQKNCDDSIIRKNNNKKKRRVIDDVDDDDDNDEKDIAEISPKDYFSKTTKSTCGNKKNAKRKDMNNHINDKKGDNDDANDDDNYAENVGVDGHPSKKIRSSTAAAESSSDSPSSSTSPSPRRSPRRSSRRVTTDRTLSANTQVETTTDKGVDGRKSKNKRRILVNDEDDNDDDTDDGNDGSYVLVNDSDDDFLEVDEDETKKKSKQSTVKNKQKCSMASRKQSKTQSPINKAKRARRSPSKSSPKERKKELIILEPNTERDHFDVDAMRVSECMAGLTFVFTGTMDELSREDAMDLVKTLGGRVTSAVSGKTNYLVVGPVLEDGRDYKEGSKYRKAVAGGDDKVKLVMGEKLLYGLCHAYHDMAVKERGININRDAEKKVAENADGISASSPGMTNSSYGKNSTVRGGAVTNPYAKSNSRVTNPYAKTNKGSASVSNPYAKANKGSVSNPYAKKSRASTTSTSSDSATVAEKGDDENSLWVDRYKPTHTQEILGNKTNVKKLQDWLRTWEKVFNNAKSSNKAYSNPRGPWKAALLSGPPGIGKTTTATLVAKEDGRDVLEFNASDVRSKKALQSAIGDLTGSQGISFVNMKSKNKNKNSQKVKPYIQKRCIIMDEVDGMGAGDRNGMSELIQIIKKSLTPIICICNDRQSQKMKSLLPYCMDLRYSRPTKGALANRAIRIANDEGMTVERNAAEAIAESCGNDVRQVINLLQMWAQKKDDGGEVDGEGGGSSTLTYKKLKDRGRSIHKDEMLRVNLFDAAKLIIEGPRDLMQADDKTKLSSLMKRSDAFFVDYSFTGLIVQQNYPKVVQSQYLREKQKGDEAGEQRLLERLHQAAESMSDYDLTDSAIRNGDLNWSLLPAAAMLTVKTGYHAGGEYGGFLGGYPEFTSWMGKNSTKGKNYRLLNELMYHMNYKVSANGQELRQTYIPVMRERILELLKNGDTDSNREAIALMDEYGLSRDDVADKLDVLVLGKKEFSFDDLDSKQKAAFTREYNAGAHKSQVLVREQGGEGMNKKRGRRETAVVNEDEDEKNVDSSDEEIDHEKEMEKLAAQFKKKGRKKKATAKRRK